MTSLKIKLLTQIHGIFMRNGIRSVTMDDISRGLSISKKTLYKYVTDKGDLVCQVMSVMCEEEEETIVEIAKENNNAIDEIIEIAKYVNGRLKQIHPSIHYDLEKYYPEAWERFTKHKLQFILNTVKSNLERGIKQGLYRKNLNCDIIAKLYISKIDVVFDGRVFPPHEHSFVDVYDELMRYHIKGIASEKGLTYLSEKLKKERIEW